MRKVLEVGLVAVLVGVVAATWKDLARYLKIRQM
jgi:hypothetical protein